jgi:hypothetical protein
MRSITNHILAFLSKDWFHTHIDLEPKGHAKEYIFFCCLEIKWSWSNYLLIAGAVIYILFSCT